MEYYSVLLSFEVNNNDFRYKNPENLISNAALVTVRNSPRTHLQILYVQVCK